MYVNIEKLNIYVTSSCLQIAEISKKSGIDAVTISRILSGKQKPRRSTIGRLAKALNCNVTDILE